MHAKLRSLWDEENGRRHVGYGTSATSPGDPTKSALGCKPDHICSERVFRLLTHCGHSVAKSFWPRGSEAYDCVFGATDGRKAWLFTKASDTTARRSRSIRQKK